MEAGWARTSHTAFSGHLANTTPLRFLAAVRRVGPARLSRFIWRHSHGH